ncbi:hypothetical protein GN956_G26554, partial [Arapaima gigas]
HLLPQGSKPHEMCTPQLAVTLCSSKASSLLACVMRTRHIERKKCSEHRLNRSSSHQKDGAKWNISQEGFGVNHSNAAS